MWPFTSKPEPPPPKYCAICGKRKDWQRLAYVYDTETGRRGEKQAWDCPETHDEDEDERRDVWSLSDLAKRHARTRTIWPTEAEALREARRTGPKRRVHRILTLEPVEVVIVAANDEEEQRIVVERMKEAIRILKGEG